MSSKFSPHGIYVDTYEINAALKASMLTPMM